MRACEDDNSELQPAQGDGARGSCRVARAVESGLRGRRSCVCTRAVAQRDGGEQTAAHAAGQGEILAGGADLDPLQMTRFSHTQFF